MPSQTISSNATLHALTERLASHSRSLHPFLNSNLSSFSPHSLAAAASAYRQPAPPPSLPVLQLVGRHQDIPASQLPPPLPDAELDGKPSGVPNGVVNGGGHRENRCPAGNAWPERNEHSDKRCSRCEEDELDDFVADMGLVLRREYDCWVEQCWTEAFHHLFTITIPNLLIHLILTGASPTFLRRQIVHGGPDLDYLFTQQMLDLLYQELELRLCGARPSEASSSSTPRPPASPTQPNAQNPPAPRDGVCFHDLGYIHGLSSDEDDHASCLCQLTTCLGCFHHYAVARRGPISLLPYELASAEVSEGWTGGVESAAQAEARRNGWRPVRTKREDLPEGKGFVLNPKPRQVPKPPPMFPHPQMTDVLAVEEHLRWRLKEMGASDPAVENRYGPCTNSLVALEGIDLPDLDSEDGDSKSSTTTKGPKVIKVTRGKGKVRRVVNGVSKKDKDGKDKGKISYLPKEWAEADPAVRNTAVTLTFRHFVKLLHTTATCSSPFSYPSYSQDIQGLDRVHPIALYRRLTEPAVVRRKVPAETRAWIECMDKWAEELGAREKTQGNKLVNENRQAEAIEYYTRAISLDAKKTVYFSNRAVALNTLGQHERAESDCRHIIAKDSKNGKAFYQRAVARRGMGKWREAEADLREVLRFQPGNDSAKKLMGIVKAEVAQLPKQRVEDVMDF
ncbi:hypothetical protein BCR39DRAFT_466943 [Naematelia encephala]|uniref:Uncharacterized protein n=1 Tax=Naematelia encephala TaxID=71784 RepID=A0A1Y2B583_9TREE|nr:hypothetical protein BCR39DRAFT_466943 [Naematelia encephala]